MKKFFFTLVFLIAITSVAQEKSAQKDSVQRNRTLKDTIHSDSLWKEGGKVLLDSLQRDSIIIGGKAGKDKTGKDTVQKEYMIIEGDTVPREFIDLEAVVLLEKLKFDNELERRRYLILKRKTQKVFPYAKLASERLVELKSRLSQIESRREQKRYTKIVQNYIEEQFSAELKKLTRTEGQILVKLIHRQTGTTAFDLIKDLKSGWRAFWYNTTASLFDISLKEEYNPQNNQEDYLIEDILQRAFQANELEEQPTALDFDFLELTDKWSASKKNGRNSKT